jgi:hypothetical protein
VGIRQEEEGWGSEGKRAPPGGYLARPEQRRGAWRGRWQGHGAEQEEASGKHTADVAILMEISHHLYRTAACWCAWSK